MNKFARFAFIALASVSLAACGSQSGQAVNPGQGVPNPGVSQPANSGNSNSGAGSSAGSKPVAGAATANNPTPQGDACGIYLSKPTSQQLIDRVRANAGSNWDNNPAIHSGNNPLVPAKTRDEYVKFAERLVTDRPTWGGVVSGVPSVVELLDAVRPEGPTAFGKFLCSQADVLEAQALPIESAGSDAASNLLDGFFLCQKMAAGIENPGETQNQVFDSETRYLLCPQVPLPSAIKGAQQ